MLYFDHAATSWPKPPSVIKAVTEALDSAGGNPGRGSHTLADTAARCLTNCRIALARMLKVSAPERVVFTSGTTEGMNMILKGTIDQGQAVASSSMEHNSVMRPLTSISRDRGVELRRVSADAQGYLDLDELAEVVEAVDALVVCHGSNVTGTLQDLPRIAEIVTQSKRRPWFVVDGAQTVGLVPIDLEELGIDALVFSGHKALLGPMGTGAVALGTRLAERVRPWLEGGTGSRSEQLEQPDELPERLESGTPNTPGIAGLAAAVEYVERTGLDEIASIERERIGQLWERIEGTEGIELYGPPPGKPRTGVLSFNVTGQHPADVAAALDGAFEVACRAGLHCAPMAHRAIGTFPTGTVRLSVGHLTTEDEIEQAAEAVCSVIEMGE